MRWLAFFNAVFLFLLVLPLCSAAHFIVGFANDALDGTPANGETIVLWNPANGLSDNLTDTVGSSGNSGVDNVYLFDCELLSSPCEVGDEIRVQVIYSSNDYISNFASVSVTGAGFDIAPNLTLNSPPVLLNLSVDDSFSVPSGEIDLTPANTTEVICQGVLLDYDGDDSIVNVSAEFFDNSGSFYGDVDDNNLHYSNSSCFFDAGYGDGTEVSFSCSFQAEYYANSGDWNCTVNMEDNLSISNIGSNNSNINSLLALSVPSPLDFGEAGPSQVSDEVEVNVTNAGNVMVNLSLSGYGGVVGDGLIMNCTGTSQNISTEHGKYNLTSSNPGSLSFSELEYIYSNLTSTPIVRRFDLDYRTNDVVIGVDETNSTYWRVYLPPGVTGSCSGNVVFGAVQAEGI